MYCFSSILTILSAAACWHLASAGHTTKPPAFFLAGDSMTAVQSSGGGGYGLGFLSFLKAPAWGVDYGQDGATTVSYRQGGPQGNWTAVMAALKGAVGEYEVYVPIMFGANDQKAAANETLQQYQNNLQGLAKEVNEAGGTSILLTPMSRRDYSSTGVLALNLADQRTYTIYAATNTSTMYLDFNQASVQYLEAIGNASAQNYDLQCTDETHLNSWGSVVFGRMLADLLLGHVPTVGVDVTFAPDPKAYFTQWFVPNATLSEDIWGGVATYGGSCPLEE
ncbi:unnamed protein product [Discula destructiva]